MPSGFDKWSRIPHRSSARGSRRSCSSDNAGHICRVRAERLATRAEASSLSRTGASSSTGECALLLSGSGVVGRASCDQYEGMHGGVPVPSGWGSASNLRFVDGRLGLPFPQGTSQSLGALGAGRFLWSLASLGYVPTCVFHTDRAPMHALCVIPFRAAAD